MGCWVGGHQQMRLGIASPPKPKNEIRLPASDIAAARLTRAERAPINADYWSGASTAASSLFANRALLRWRIAFDSILKLAMVMTAPESVERPQGTTKFDP